MQQWVKYQKIILCCLHFLHHNTSSPLPLCQ